MNIQDYENQLEGKECRWCKDSSESKRRNNCSLEGLRILQYNHDGGYKVDGFEKPQWLYVVCPNCDYQWSLQKLGIAQQINPPDTK